MEHPQRIESNVVAYLQGLSTFSSGLTIHAGETDEEKTSATIIARVDGDMGDEEPPFSNNRWCDFVIELRTPVTQDDPDTDWEAQHESNAAALEDAVLTDAFESSISGSTLYAYRAVNRTAIREQNQDMWISGYRFRIYSCRV
jgi:hypothetical protein